MGPPQHGSRPLGVNGGEGERVSQEATDRLPFLYSVSVPSAARTPGKGISKGAKTAPEHHRGPSRKLPATGGVASGGLTEKVTFE